MTAAAKSGLVPLALLLAGAAFAQDYPNKPIRLVAPFSPGGATDVLTRIVGQKITERMGQPVVTALPKEMVARLNTEISNAITAPELKEKLTALGAEPSIKSPDQFAQYVREEIVKWAKVVKESGAKLD